MGFWGELVKAVATEIGGNIIDSINEANEQLRLPKSELEEVNSFYSKISLSELEWTLENGQEENTDEWIMPHNIDQEKAIIKNIIEERKQLIHELKNNYNTYFPAFAEWMDELINEKDYPAAAAEVYEKMRESACDLYGEDDCAIVIMLFFDLMKRYPAAKQKYECDLKDEMDSTPYSLLEDIITSTDAADDPVRKKYAKIELEYRNGIINRVINEIEYLDNDEFMELYDSVRKDKCSIPDDYLFDDEHEADISEFSWWNYGEYTNEMRACFERELGNRKYLIRDFIDSYCEEEFEEFLNTSTRELKDTLYQIENTEEDEFLFYEYDCYLFAYDAISAIMINAILKKRNQL